MNGTWDNFHPQAFLLALCEDRLSRKRRGFLSKVKTVTELSSQHLMNIKSPKINGHATGTDLLEVPTIYKA